MPKENPGSFNEWAQRHEGLEIDYSEYSKELSEFRTSLAEERGMTGEEFLESFRSRTIVHAGELVVEHEMFHGAQVA